MSSRRSAQVAVVGILVAALSPLAAAKQPVFGAPLVAAQLGGDSYARDMRVAADGVPRAIYEVAYRATPSTPEAMARQYLRDNAALLRLRDASLADLAYLGTRSGPAGHNVRFAQHSQGLAVAGGRLDVHINRDNVVTHVASAYRPDAHLPDTVALVPAARAMELVRARIGAAGDAQFQRVELVALPMAGLTHLAWQVQTVVPRPIGDWEGFVDARTGAMLSVRDRSLYQARGSIFDPDPLSSARRQYGEDGLSDGGDQETPGLAAQRFDVAFDGVQAVGSNYRLRSQWAEVTDHEAPRLGVFAQSSPDFVFTRDQDGFEAANTFWHVHESMRYINETLGLNVRPYQYPGGVQFDPHGLDAADNSHYVPSTGQLAFGEGCVDDAEDADVVRHELAHGLHDWVTDGGLSNMIDGLSEGIADYWAHSYSRSLGHWSPQDPEYHWVFNWDGHNECWAGRITNYDLPWPAGIQPYPFIHTSGQIISTCLMQVYDQIGREPTDRMLLEGLAMTNANSTQNDAANAMHQAALDMGYAAADIAVIEDTFASCGYILGTGVLLAPPPGNAAGSAAPAGKAAGSAGAASGWASLALLLGAALRRRGARSSR